MTLELPGSSFGQMVKQIKSAEPKSGSKANAFNRLNTQ